MSYLEGGSVGEAYIKALESIIASGLRYLAMIDFKPERDNLNLMAVFRSLYFDTKRV
ncbi:MAG: hypothetical protein ACXQTS_00360 [Candidatus Methanospirareceae archaeon]